MIQELQLQLSSDNHAQLKISLNVQVNTLCEDTLTSSKDDKILQVTLKVELIHAKTMEFVDKGST